MNSKVILATIILLVIVFGLVGCRLGTEGGITHQEYLQQVPLYPSDLTVEVIENSIVLGWLGTGADDIQYYQIYRTTLNTSDWQQLAKIEVVGENEGDYQFVDTAITPRIGYVYGVSAVAVYGKASEISVSAVITP